MFRTLAKHAFTSVKYNGMLKNRICQPAIGSFRNSSKHTETDEEFDARYEAYFNKANIDGWEIRKAMNDLQGMDLVPEPKIVIAALKACRRVNDFALAVRYLEAIRMGMAADLSEFDKGQIIMARRLVRAFPRQQGLWGAYGQSWLVPSKSVVPSKEKCGSKVKEIYPYILQEIRPTLDELGVNTPEEMGYDKPELFLENVFDK